MKPQTTNEMRTSIKSAISMDPALFQYLRYRWRAPLALVSTLFALNLLDTLTTHIGLQLGAVEANPIVANLIGEVGAAPAYAAKISFVLIAGILLLRMGRTTALSWLNRGMAMIVALNIIVLTYQVSS
jgi:hypothetical protein